MVDMTSPAELQRWVYQTVLFAHLSKGRELSFQDARQEADTTVLAQQPITHKIAVVECLKLAHTILLRECPVREDFESKEERDQAFSAVNNWILKSVAAVCVARGTDYTPEKLEYLADANIVSRVQGNKVAHPTKADLDMLIHGTVNWSLGYLGVHETP